MRKLYLLVASTVALVAFMGFSATAFATAVDPSCDLGHDHGDADGPYNNDAAVHGFTLETTNNISGAVSGITGSGLACGTEIGGNLFPIGGHTGEGTLNDNVDIVAPRGVKVNPTADMEVGSYVGGAIILSATWMPVVHAAIIPTLIDFSVAPIGTSDQPQTCAWEAARAVGGLEPGEIVACYRGTTDPDEIIQGQNFNWQTLGPDGRYTLTIGRFYNEVIPHNPGEEFVVAGLTDIRELMLCDRVGAPIGPGTGGECGSGTDPWVQKNGSCGLAAYKVTVTNKAGEETEPVYAQINWDPNPYWPQGRQVSLPGRPNGHGTTRPGLSEPPAQPCIGLHDTGWVTR